MLDRPDFEIAGAGHVGLRYGIFIALIGAALMIVGGMRGRREKIDRDQGETFAPRM